MARQEIGIGTAPTGVGGDTTRSTAIKINAMTTELYARNAQLGTASNANIGTDIGNVMGVGAFGNGVEYSTGLPLCSDISGSQVSKTGTYRYSSTTTGRPEYGTGFGVIQQFSATFDGTYNYGAQIAVDYAATEMMMRRLTGSSGWSAWAKFYSTSNTTRAADGTLKAI
ncbi:hypothetical protein [Pseudomonas orientalis]|uniref:hypothetical protein n=1 Tax=Pseudomonas orientalis TaxID=76758 RepID=UPI000F5753E2|nr:hypothetical protein [Pseudomonas orientalis]AZE90200.1 hypothetical protein C4J97_3507 [Pseudomonas orientalis]